MGRTGVTAESWRRADGAGNRSPDTALGSSVWRPQMPLWNPMTRSFVYIVHNSPMREMPPSKGFRRTMEGAAGPQQEPRPDRHGVPLHVAHTGLLSQVYTVDAKQTPHKRV